MSTIAEDYNIVIKAVQTMDTWSSDPFYEPALERVMAYLDERAVDLEYENAQLKAEIKDEDEPS